MICSQIKEIKKSKLNIKWSKKKTVQESTSLLITEKIRVIKLWPSWQVYVLKNKKRKEHFQDRADYTPRMKTKTFNL